MHLRATITPTGAVWGTVANTQQATHPLGHPVPVRFTMLHPSQPKLGTLLEDGSVVEFHIATMLGSLVYARCLPPQRHRFE